MSGHKPLYVKGWTASKTTNIKSHIPTISLTCLPFPFLAPSVIPGTFNTYNLFPQYRKMPCIHIKVVNSLSWTSENVSVYEFSIDSTCSLLSFAILSKNKPRWGSMALFFGSRIFLLLFLLSIKPHSFILKYFFK